MCAWLPQRRFLQTPLWGTAARTTRRWLAPARAPPPATTIAAMTKRLPQALVATLAASLLLAAGASAETRTFSNTQTIAPDDPPSGSVGIDPAHYPSEIKVAGVPGTISKVEVKLNGVGTA